MVFFDTRFFKRFNQIIEQKKTPCKHPIQYKQHLIWRSNFLLITYIQPAHLPIPMSRRWGKKKPPSGYEYIQPTIDALASELRDVNSQPSGGKQKLEANWPIHQINNQRTRYIYDMYSVHHKISRELYMYCVKEKLVDTALVAKWKKPGFEKLCSVFVIDRRNFPFGTTAICRVPKKSLGNKIIFEANTGCRGCASGNGTSNIFGTKYGQRLARVQVAREAKLEAQFGQAIDTEGEQGASGTSASAGAPGPWATMDSSDDDSDDDEEEDEEGKNTSHKRRADDDDQVDEPDVKRTKTVE